MRFSAARSLTAVAVSLSLAACNSSTSASYSTIKPQSALTALIHDKVKHVFIIVQENHTFDNYFGLYPGNGQTVENLASSTAQADECMPDPDAGTCQKPFLITTNTASANYVQDAPDIGGGSNSRYGQQLAIDGGKMDMFLSENEAAGTTTGSLTAQSHNTALQTIATYDCDTVPYLWYYAKNFTLFDHYFQANVGQSTPGNVQLFSAQFGQTEVAAGKATVLSTLSGTGYTDGMPLGNDNNPPQSQLSAIGINSYSGADANQYISVASLPVLLSPSEDAAALNASITGLIPDDIALESKTNRNSVPWAWYEEGLLYPADGTSASTWSQHHTSPLYFDYINHTNSAYSTTATLRDNTPSNGLISDISGGKLATTGVYWVKGGVTASPYGFKPADSVLANNNQYTGDDDHEGNGDSDHQVAEAYVATLINTIANSKYWKDSVIILTWDDSGGMYDHLPPPKFGSACPDDTTGKFAGIACGDGVRLPMLVISPFSKNGVVVHDQSDSGSVSKFVEDVFALPTLASLPDEAAGVKAGLAPADANTLVSDLSGALDANKLAGSVAPNPAGLAMIPAPAVPPAMSCATLGITPIASPAALPAGFETTGYYENLHFATGKVIEDVKPNDDGD